MSRTNKIIWKMKENKLPLTFKKINNVKKFSLLTFSEVFQHGASQRSYLMLLTDNEENIPYSLAIAERKKDHEKLTCSRMFDPARSKEKNIERNRNSTEK